jgi:DNA repair photolyase
MKVTKRSGSFIKQFGGPGDDNEIVCFKFWQAVIASGCPGACSYCFLQTQYPYRTGLYDIKGTLFENLPEIVPQVRGWLKKSKNLGLILGENQDGLAFEGSYKKLLGTTPLELLMPLFEHENPNGNLLIVLSKFTSTQFAEARGAARNTIFSWSLSLPSISKKYELGVASLDARLKKAREMKAKGFRVRFRLDALAPIENWEVELCQIIAQINEIEPEMLTLGALRASNTSALRAAAEKNNRDASIFDYISTRDPSGFKYRTEYEFHKNSFAVVKNEIKPSISLGLCKEDASLWKDIELPWRGCHCLNGASDPVTAAKSRILTSLNG